jgi:pyruvate/2-oxoglutarate dehydrogenase complex dihydrolipoamide dehydrogenase (E3) component
VTRQMAAAGDYSVPEISTVGMSEEEVRRRKIPHECGVARFRETLCAPGGSACRAGDVAAREMP